MPHLSDRIYRAQCFGNVEPVEHMVPYSNLAGLVEGATIKFSKEACFPDWSPNNGIFRDQVHIAANWLQQQGYGPGDRLQIFTEPEPVAHYFAFAAWMIGATLVISHGPADDVNIPRLANVRPHAWDVITQNYQGEFNPAAVPLLTDEACLVRTTPSPVRLSHYQLLVNVNGLCAGIPVTSQDTIFSCLNPFTLSWVLFQVLLPFYANCTFSARQPNMTFGTHGNPGKKDFIITSEWKDTFHPHELYLRPETGGVLCIGGHPIHLMALSKESDRLAVNGHGVMMGYVSEDLNETVFHDDRCFISL